MATTQIKDRQVLAPGGDTRDNYQTQVAARMTDTGRLPAPDQTGLNQLLSSLSQINPIIGRFAAEKSSEDGKAGATDRATGQDQRDGASSAYVNGYLGMDGQVKGDQDGASIWAAYHTEFDKDSGDVEEFLAKQYGSRMQGSEEGAYKDGYDRAIVPMLQNIRAEQRKYHATRTVERAESNGLYLLDQGLRSYVGNGESVPDSFLDTVRLRLKDVGVSASRFEELLFASAKKLGDEGNYAVYELFKRDRADGSPGLYFSPKWKADIDAAESKAVSTFLTHKATADKAAKEDREARQDKAMLDIIMDPDPKSAQLKFDDLQRSGLFANASELIKWRRELDSSVKREARADQMETANALQFRIMTGQAKLTDIRDADLTPEQKRSLWADLDRKGREDRVASAQVKAADAQAKAAQKEAYRTHRDYLEGVLKTSPGQFDTYGYGNEAQRRLRATAILEFDTRVSRGEDASTVSDEVSKRYIPRFQEMSKAKGGDELRALLRFNTPADLAQSLKEGRISRQEFNQQATIFRSLAPKGPTQQ